MTIQNQKIGIDARFFGCKNGGLGRYTMKLVQMLEQIDQTNKYIIFLTKENYDLYQPKAENFSKKLIDIPWYSWKEQLILPFILNRQKVDLIHFPHFNVPLLLRKPFIVTIHDLILLEYPTKKDTTLSRLYYWIKESGYKIVLWSSLFFSRKIITVSFFTKKTILNYFPKLKKEKIKVIHEACLDRPNDLKLNQRIKKSSLPKVNINRYLLYVGSAYPHKNLTKLLLAFKALIQDKKYRDLKLCLVGDDHYFYKKIKKFVHRKKITNVIFQGLVTDDAFLKALYQNCLAFVFPSLYEGFGFPPLEAMLAGAPVISSDKASIKEVLEDSAYYFDALNPRDMRDKIKHVLENPQLRQDLINKGKQQVQKYSWEKNINETLKTYQS